MAGVLLFVRNCFRGLKSEFFSLFLNNTNLITEEKQSKIILELLFNRIYRFNYLGNYFLQNILKMSLN